VADSNPTQIPDGVPAERVDALYGLPSDEFTPARDALAKELRSAGERDAAAWVKALRKPSAPAWLVNQLARTQGKAARRLIEAGENLQAAQQRVLAGKSSAGELARAGVEQGEAIGGLMSLAPGVLDSDGHSPSAATLEKAEQTLRAVPLDQQARDEFAVGRLTREHRATGFGLLDAGGAAAPAAPAAPAKPKPKRSDKQEAAADKAAAREKQRHIEQRAKARQALKDARALQAARRRAVTEAKGELSQARREAERAERRLQKASEALERAEAAEADAAGGVAEAEAALKRAS
jgi:hypothetical protein